MTVLVPADIRFPLERANGVQIVKTAAALARAGAETRLFVRKSDERSAEEILALYGLAADPRLSVTRTVQHRVGSHVVPRATFLVKAFSAALRAARRGAIVYTRDLQLAEVLVRFVPAIARRVVYEAHAVEALLYRERGVLYGSAEVADERKARRLFKREQRVWAGARAVVTTTAGIRDTFAESYGARERVTVVPNGCDVPDGGFPGLPAEPRILYAGQLYPWKGVDVLIEALAAVPAAQLTIVGGFPQEKDLPRVQALVQQRNLAERVTMTGHVPQSQVAAELSRARIVAVPFLQSGMTERHTSPIKLFEAMAAGRAIVATDLPSTREVVQHEKTALLVQPGDAGALAAALRRLMEEPGLAERLARAAFAEAPRFSWDARARALLSVFEEAS